MAPTSNATQGSPRGFRERVRRVTHRLAHTKVRTKEKSETKEGQEDAARQTNTVGGQTGNVRTMAVIGVIRAIAPEWLQIP